jgi:glucose/arabinose dehydrogenase
MLDRRTLLAAAAAGAVTPALTAASATGAPKAGKVLAQDLQVPWGVAFLPDGDALVGERPNGNVHRVRRTGGRSKVGTLSAVVDNGEGGLLGIAVAPTFAEDRWVYFFFTSDGDNRVVRKRFRDGGLGRSHVLLDGIPTASYHNGGRLAFGPDGMLYASTGDAGDTSRAQDKKSLGGKILRMTPSGGVPDENPFGTRVWTYGHRNVQGLAWDSAGHMWATELGQNTRDELNRIRPGRNYGWPEVEGGDGDGPYADPFVTWSPTSTCSPSGVAIAGGRAWVGALAGRSLYSVRLSGPHKRRKVRHFHDDFGRIRTVQKAPDGSLWITTSNRDGRGSPVAADDRVIRITL